MALVDVHLDGELAALPAISDFGAKRECGLGRGCQAPHRDLTETVYKELDAMKKDEVDLGNADSGLEDGEWRF